MLEHADDNARANTLFFSIRSDDALATRRRGDKLFPRRLGNGKIGCPFIGFYLLLGVVSVGFVDKDAFLAVKQDFHCFMEGAEPEVIIGLVPGVQLDDGPPRRQRPSRAAERLLSQRLHQRQCDACLVAKSCSLLQCLHDLLYCQATDSSNRMPESALIVVRALLMLSLNLSRPEPSGQSGHTALEAPGVAIGDIGEAVANSPGID